MRLVGGCLLLSIAVLAVPLLLVQVPPVVDFPNHLARLWLIAGGAASPPAGAFYAIDWSRAQINIGIDLVAVALGGLFPAGELARGLLGVALVLPVAGAALLGRAIAGRWHAGLLLLPLLAWNFPFVVGFMNQQIATGIALLAAAFEPRMPRRRAAAPIRMAIILVTAIVHPLGAALYLGLLGAWCLSPTRRLPDVARDLSRRMLPPLAAIALLVLSMPQAPGFDAGGSIAGQPRYLGLGQKVATLLAPFASYAPLTEGALGVMLLAVLAGMAAAGALRADRGFLTLAGALGFLAMLGPDNLGDTGSMGLRLGALAMVLLVIAVAPATSLGQAERRIAAGLTGLVIVRTAWIAHVWLTAAPASASVQAAISHLPPGARLMVLLDMPDRSLGGLAPGRDTLPIGSSILLHTTFQHYPLLAIPAAGAFVPYLFAAEGKQPVRILPPYDGVATPDGGPLPLVAWQDGHARAATRLRSFFDYVLIIAPTIRAAVPEGLDPVADAGFARLYRLRAAMPPG